MGRRATPQSDPDRYLRLRDGHWHYVRRIPRGIVELVGKRSHVRVSLKTDDKSIARIKRDHLEAADNDYWASFLSNQSEEVALRRYQSAVRRADAIGLTYRPVHEILQRESLPDVVARFEAIMDERTPPAVVEAALGGIDIPRVTVTQAFKVYCDEIKPAELRGKSEAQKKSWKKVKLRAVNNFVALNGDMAMDEIERRHALKLFGFWRDRIAPTGNGARPTHNPSSGKKDMGNMRQLFREYWAHVAPEEQRANPFDGLTFGDSENSRPPFTHDWMVNKIMAAGAMANFNDELRGIAYMVAAVGARPSEIANLDAPVIVLNAPVPHILIAPRTDPDDPRQTKTRSSIRAIPLVGLALAVMQRFPSGFPRYFNKEGTLSNTLNKAMREAGLIPDEIPPGYNVGYSAYSMRHSFEDRMKTAGLDEELRKILMGHAIDRPRYGVGGALEWRAAEIEKVNLPFDEASI
ncbi:hypothetical protein XM25_19725 [Devosia sp. H5989]|nr:hypothetical protein XM25_19725 [Devosia sp. H5989]